MLSGINAETRIAAFLNKHLTDYNTANRVGAQWIYTRKPAILDMLSEPNRFPVVTVSQIGPLNSQPLGINGDDLEETVTLLVNVWTIKDMVLDVMTQTGFSWTSGSDITPTIIPIDVVKSVICILDGVTTDITADCILIDSDSDGLYDTVRIDRPDVADISVINICNTARVAEGQVLAERIAEDANEEFRDWYDELSPYLWDYLRVGFTAIDFDQHIGLYRHELQAKFSGVNIGSD